MTQWNWLTKPQTPYRWRFAAGVIVKGLLLFAIANVLFALLDPLPLLGRLSVYNWLAPGRLRLPYADNPSESYSVSLLNLNAMFASHEINGAAKAPDEFRVLVIGDSSIWGVLLNPDQTLPAYLNAAQAKTASGKRIRVFNIGYPIQSLMKDVLLLNEAKRYQPDLIVWMITLESFAPSNQLAPLLVRENPDSARSLIRQYGIKTVQVDDARFVEHSFLERTIVGQRRALADLLRYQLYGMTWSITQIDQQYPRFYEPRRENFEPDTTWRELATPQTITTENTSFDVLQTGLKIAGSVPVLIVNEPIFRSHGINSDIRYSFFYPRWAYDSYRELMTQQAMANGWSYLDLWDAIATDQFTDSAVHLTPAGSRLEAARVMEAIMAATK